MKAVGVILIVLGIIALAYQGYTYTTREEVLDLGGLKVTSEAQHTVWLPPVLGGLAVAAGILLVIIGASQAKGTATKTTTVHTHTTSGGDPTA